jgi:hypothetical protein
MAAWWKCPRALQLPRPQAPAEAMAQAGCCYLGLRQGLPLPGWFFAGIARGREKGSEKGPLGSMGCHPRPGDNGPQHLLHTAEPRLSFLAGEWTPVCIDM